MFKSRTLAYAYCLTNFQEATLNAVKKKSMTNFGSSNVEIFNNGSTSSVTQMSLLAFPNTVAGSGNHKLNTQLGGQGKRLSQKEYTEKRAQNLFFYYDQKYVPGHKCSG